MTAASSGKGRVRASPLSRFSQPSLRLRPVHPNLALLPTQLALLLTMSLVARTSALRRQIVLPRASVPSRGVHGYKVCALVLLRNCDESLNSGPTSTYLSIMRGRSPYLAPKLPSFFSLGSLYHSLPLTTSCMSKIFGRRCHVGLTAVSFQ